MSDAITDIESFHIYSDRAAQLLEAFNIDRRNDGHGDSSRNKTGANSTLKSSSLNQSIGVRGRAHFSDSDDDDESSSEDEEVSQNENSNSKEQGSAKSESSGNQSAKGDIRNTKIKTNTSVATKGNISGNGSGSKLKKQKHKRTKEDLLKQIGLPPSASITIDVQTEPIKVASVIQLPMVLLPQEEEEESNPYIIDENKLTPLNKLYNLANNLNQPLSTSVGGGNGKDEKNLILVLTLQSGRFAAAIFHKDKCIKHKTSTRYTTRKGQGGSQSSNDNAKGKANSIGSQLRRAGETQLRQDVAATLREWSGLLGECALYFISLSKNLQKGFWDDVNAILGGQGSHHHASKTCNFYKKSPYVVGIPLDVGRPSYEGCCAVYDLLTLCVLKRIDLELVEQEQNHQEVQGSNLEVIAEDASEEVQNQNDAIQSEKEEISFPPLTPLHEAARDGNIEALLEILSIDDDPDDIDKRVGPESMTPLHYAASFSKDPECASKCVHALLVQGHANPCILDSRNRPPYFLAANENIRNAFRRARSELGEDSWKWTDSAKVASPLSSEDLALKKDKAAEKKRRQRQRQKERKAKEKAESAEAEKKLQEEKERQQKEEDAKRTRAGLKPKPEGSLRCDFCQKPCKRKSQMFARLDFLYCSTDCVKKHQRELMAAAAAARFNNNK